MERKYVTVFVSLIVKQIALQDNLVTVPAAMSRGFSRYVVHFITKLDSFVRG